GNAAMVAAFKLPDVCWVEVKKRRRKSMKKLAIVLAVIVGIAFAAPFVGSAGAQEAPCNYIQVGNVYGGNAYVDGGSCTDEVNVNYTDVDYSADEYNTYTGEYVYEAQRVYDPYWNSCTVYDQYGRQMNFWYGPCW